MTTEQLDHYLQAWDLSDPQPLASTVTSNLYTVTSNGSRAVLKVLTPVGDEERMGALALRYFDGRGAVRLLRSDDDAQLLEYAAGEDLTGMVRDGDDDGATAIIADVLNTLHSVSAPPPPAGLMSLDVRFRALFHKAAEDRREGVASIYVRAATIAEKLLREADPADVCVLHGDIHHENIRHKDGRGWLALDPKGLVGDRAFDTANVIRNPPEDDALVLNEARIVKTAGILGEKMNIDPARILNYVFVLNCLSACWLLNDGADPDKFRDLRLAALVEPLTT
jgi:streptomycin 6-kinase